MILRVSSAEVHEPLADLADLDDGRAQRIVDLDDGRAQRIVDLDDGRAQRIVDLGAGLSEARSARRGRDGRA
jgi:hypothetical protein